MVAGIGTGKTYCLLLKIMKYCLEYPNSLALIVRREFTDLRDSTIKDFTRYFHQEIDGNKEFHLPNGSVLMFRHGAELDVLKNINLSIFGIEQAEEFESDEHFTMLRGRLRREGAPYRQGCIIANVAGDNWVKHLWKDKMLADAELIEATTFDNASNLPKDFIDDLKRTEIESPLYYRQYVLNDWSITADQFFLIPAELITALEGKHLYHNEVRRVIAVDPSQGGDECVLYFIENTVIKDTKIMHVKDTMTIAGEIATMMYKHNTSLAAIDSIGIGAGICDRLRELGKDVLYINSAEKPFDENRFYNKRAEMWWYTMEQARDGILTYPHDAELRRQLSSVRYKVINSSGKIQLEPKDETKKRINRSPDRADAFVYGVWALQNAKPITKDAWKDEHRFKTISGGARSAMAA